MQADGGALQGQYGRDSRASRLGTLLTGISIRRKSLKHRVIGLFGPVTTVEQQRRAVCSARMTADPRVLIGKTPGLDGGAAWILQAHLRHSPIDPGLTPKVSVERLARGTHRYRDIEFCNVNLQPQRSESRNVCGDCSSIELEIRNVHLQADSVDGDAAPLEFFDHGVDCIGFTVQGLAFRLVVKKKSMRIGLTRPSECLDDVSRVSCRRVDARSVVPRRILEPTALI